MTSTIKRFPVFTSEAGHKVAVNPDHVLMVEPRGSGTTIFLSGPGASGEGLHRDVRESFDEVMRSLRDEPRPRMSI
jgi:hypothetical protein